MKTHAQVPTPLVCEDVIRVYFSSRPERKLSLTTFVDLDLNDPSKILRLNSNPILEPGKPGTFDEHGIMPSSAVRTGNKVLLYYSGWSRGASVPYINSTGLAISHDGGNTFEKISEGPILTRSLYEPYSATSPHVMVEGGDWHMWYCSGTSWIEIEGKSEHTYDIKYAHSRDGVNWTPSSEPVIRQRSQFEAITRPSVAKIDGRYHMWFCYRGSHSFRDGKDAYRIGYARSENLQEWRRDDDQSGIGPSEHGWDSKMVGYPAVVTANNRTFMFYNGNEFGFDGFGYAILA
jgi:hypothetical protein